MRLSADKYGIPVMTKRDLAVIEAAEAYVDQLGAFNDLHHSEVQKARKRLAKTVAKRLKA